MSYSCTQWRGDIGACIVGALDGWARQRLTGHLKVCPGCQADYDELVPVRRWLSILALTAARPDAGRATRQATRFQHDW